MPDSIAQTAFDLAARPGFLIRRLHQIHVALFIEECAGFDVTPVQYSIMSAVQSRPGLDQARLGEEVGVDRATLANVVGRLEARGLVRRRTGAADRRLRLVEITDHGALLLGQMEAPARRAHARTIAALPPAQRRLFTHALASLVDAGNTHGRAPMRLG
jgi:DNA-binding MarR family transcriptional regulator